MNDPNLYGKFKPYWGCMHCAANWEQEGAVVVSGTVAASASGGCLGSDGDFVISELDTSGSTLEIHDTEGYYCIQCDEYWGGPEHYDSQAQVDTRITATPEVERTA